MSKRLACLRCRVENDYDVPADEKTASLREVRCRTCGHRFAYGFRPEYVTEAEPQQQEAHMPDEAYDVAAEAVAARDRLVRHIVRYTEYHDRDRDVLLLHLLDMADRLDGELASVKRAIDVLVKRAR